MEGKFVSNIRICSGLTTSGWLAIFLARFHKTSVLLLLPWIQCVKKVYKVQVNIYDELRQCFTIK